MPNTLKELFVRFRKELEVYIPPLYVKMNEEHHYEVWARYHHKDTFFARIIMHQEFVELSFYGLIPDKDAKDIFTADEYKREGEFFVNNISYFSTNVEQDFALLLQNLIDYFKEHKLLEPEENL